MNKAGEWLVYFFIPSTGLHFGVGKYQNKKEAIKTAYYQLACHIDECCTEDVTYSITPLYFLEGGEDMAINVVETFKDGVSRVCVTAHMILILEDDK